MQRIFFFDIARAICVLYIVGFWHLVDYLPNGIYHESSVEEAICLAALSCFTFISGFFLGKKRVKAKEFYLTRLKRFFIPLSISVLFLALTDWFESPRQVVFTLTGLSCFWGHMPKTFWYFDMLMIFYLITPLLLYKSDTRSTVLRGIIFFVLFAVLNHYNKANEVLFIYLPFYILGIVVTKDNLLKVLNNSYLIAGAIILWVICILCNSSISPYGIILMNIFGVFILLGISQVLDKYCKGGYKFFQIVSYSSMFAYLYHREVFGAVSVAYRRVYNEATGVPVYIAILMLVLTFVFSYYGQRLYDRMTRNW